MIHTGATSLLFATLLVVPGCVAFPCTRGPDRPADWDQGTELLSFYMETYHSGKALNRVYHNSTQPLEPPEECVAYRGARSFTSDDCVVRNDTQPGPNGKTFGPWFLEATYSQHCSSDGERRIVGYRASEPVAHWAGYSDPDGTHFTE